MGPAFDTSALAGVRPAPPTPGAHAESIAPSARLQTRWRIARWLLAAGVVGCVGIAILQTIQLLRRPPEVLVTAVATEDVSRMLAVTGRIEAAQSVLVSPQFPGRITEILRREGDRVRKAEILARLEDPAAKSNLLQQSAALASRKNDLRQAERDLARTTQLVATGAQPRAELESARLLVARAASDVQRLSAMLAEGRAQLVLLAPFDGTILRRDGEVGQVVGPESTLFEVATLESTRVTAQVDERYVQALRPGMRAEILPVGASTAPLSAQVSYVAQAVDPQTGAATVRFEYDHPPRDVVVGMSVDVNVSVAAFPSAVTIPREALGSAAGRPFVLVATQGHVTRREVTVEDWPAARVVVPKGLAPGEYILLDPMGAAAGAPVRVKVTSNAL